MPEAAPTLVATPAAPPAQPGAQPGVQPISHVQQHVGGKLDRAQLLATLYQYLSQRLESLTHRCSMLLAVLASYLGFITSGLMRDGHTVSVEKLVYAVTHPSVLVGLAGIG